jgi:hypothetical protein
MEHVLEEKEECQLREHGLPRRERHLPGAHAKGFSDWVKEENLSGIELSNKPKRTKGMLTAGPSTVK